MRVCELHRERSVETLRSMKDGQEYDMCQECMDALRKYFSEQIFPKPELNRGRKRAFKSVDANKGETS